MFWTRADTMSPYGADRKCRDDSLAVAIRSIPEIICSWRAFRRLSGLSQYELKGLGWLADFVEPMVTDTFIGTIFNFCRAWTRNGDLLRRRPTHQPL